MININHPYVETRVDGEASVFSFHTDLAKGSLHAIRSKFAVSGMSQAIDEVFRELETESMYLGDWKRNEIQITGIARCITNRFWTEVEYSVLFPPGKGKTEPAEGTYRVVRWNVGVDSGAAILAVDANNNVGLVNSFRHAARAWRVEIPRGLRTPGESIEECGLREAKEERGILTTPETEIFDLGTLDCDTGVLMQTPRLILIRNVSLTGANSPDLSEAFLGPITLPLQEVYAQCISGEIRDAYTAASVLRAVGRGLLTL